MNITVDRKVIEQALEALNYVMRHGPAVQKAKDLLQDALKQPEQSWTPENLAAMHRLQEKQYQRDAMRQKVQQEPVLWKDKHGKTLMSLDASQPIQELVCRTALEQPEQEPVAHQDTADKCLLETVPAKGTLFHTAPLQRKPLTDMDIADIYKKWDATPGVSMADFARAIEAAHGIKD